MADDPKAVVRAFVKEVQNDGNIDAAGKCIAEGQPLASPYVDVIDMCLPRRQILQHGTSSAS